jgi:two-component system chemotaxis sensor kinase CheA
MTGDLDPVAAFRQEAAELLDTLESALLDLGHRPQDRDLIDTAFRALHTIKGSGAMFGFDQVAAFTHDFETAFDLVRKGKADPSDDLVTVALAAKDYIRALIEDPDSTDEIIGAAVLCDLEQVIGKRENQGTRATAPIEASSPALARTARGWSIDISFAPHILRNGADPLHLLDDLRLLGECIVTPIVDKVPELAALDPQALYLQWHVELSSDCSAEAIEEVFMFVRDDMNLTVTAVDGAGGVDPEKPPGEPHHSMAEPAPRGEVMDDGDIASRVATKTGTPPTRGRDESDGRKDQAMRRPDDKIASTVRVSAERLDQLMDRVGELVIAQARLSQIATAGSDLALKAVSEEIERLAAALRDTTMGARMVPIGSLFGRFRRLVHDLSRDLGKPVEFITTGEETELDKTLIERLADPLVHLIRNAIDHGIEEPARRAAAGKPALGKIELTASHAGAQVLICVNDDGGGLDSARIRAKAEEQGLVVPGAVLSDHEIHQFLFHPGFSTAKTISTLSGRGVGMDVVKRVIEAMRGSIDITTKPGEGTRMILRLPLTLAIIEGLLVRVGEERYIIPLTVVEECVELPPSEEAARSERSLLNIRGDFVPYLRLRDLFEPSSPPDLHQKAIITSIDDMRVGLVVDQIIGSHQTVIKSLSKLHSDVTMFSGATILGDGSAALILDVAQLVAVGQSYTDSNLPEAA